MIIFQSTYALIITVVVISLHIVTAFSKSLPFKILNYVNIGLHIALFLTLILENVPIDEAVMVYMLSVFVYLAARLVRISTRGEGENRDV